jgi:hypothetical protein
MDEEQPGGLYDGAGGTTNAYRCNMLRKTTICGWWAGIKGSRGCRRGQQEQETVPSDNNSNSHNSSNCNSNSNSKYKSKSKCKCMGMGKSRSRVHLVHDNNGVLTFRCMGRLHNGG